MTTFGQHDRPGEWNLPIVYCSLELYLPYCQSLKEKRNVVRRLSGRIRSRFNFSVAEIGHQELRQRGLIGAVSIGSDRRKLEQIAEKLVRESERILGGDLVRTEIDMVDLD